jgi:hypothetical protein
MKRPQKPKKKSETQKNFARGVPKRGMEYAMFFNISEPMGKTRNIDYKEAL